MSVEEGAGETAGKKELPTADEPLFIEGYQVICVSDAEQDSSDDDEEDEIKQEENEADQKSSLTASTEGLPLLKIEGICSLASEAETESASSTNVSSGTKEGQSAPTPSSSSQEELVAPPSAASENLPSPSAENSAQDKLHSISEGDWSNGSAEQTHASEDAHMDLEVNFDASNSSAAAEENDATFLPVENQEGNSEDSLSLQIESVCSLAPEGSSGTLSPQLLPGTNISIKSSASIENSAVIEGDRISELNALNLSYLDSSITDQSGNVCGIVTNSQATSSFWCNFCRFKDTTERKFLSHILSHLFLCKHCKFRAFSRTDIIQHTRVAHAEATHLLRSFQYCCIQDGDYSSKDSVQDIGTTDNYLPTTAMGQEPYSSSYAYSCKMCNFGTNNSRSFSLHKCIDGAADKGQTIWECKHCQERFLNRADAIRHLKAFHPFEKPELVCRVPSMQAWKRLSVAPEKANVGQGSETAVAVPMAHMGVLSPQQVKEGVEVKKGSRFIFQCKNCEYSTPNFSDLQEHLKIPHTRYVLEGEGSQRESSAIKDALNQPIAVSHSLLVPQDLYHICSLCKYEARSRDELEKHQREKHHNYSRIRSCQLKMNQERSKYASRYGSKYDHLIKKMNEKNAKDMLISSAIDKNATATSISSLVANSVTSKGGAAVPPHKPSTPQSPAQLDSGEKVGGVGAPSPAEAAKLGRRKQTFQQKKDENVVEQHRLVGGKIHVTRHVGSEEKDEAAAGDVEEMNDKDDAKEGGRGSKKFEADILIAGDQNDLKAYEDFFSFDEKTSVYTCRYCSYTCRLQCHVQEHISTHTGHKLWKCAYCNYQQNRQRLIIRHTMMQHKGKKLVVIRRHRYNNLQKSGTQSSPIKVENDSPKSKAVGHKMNTTGLKTNATADLKINSLGSKTNPVGPKMNKLGHGKEMQFKTAQNKKGRRKKKKRDKFKDAELLAAVKAEEKSTKHEKWRCGICKVEETTKYLAIKHFRNEHAEEEQMQMDYVVTEEGVEEVSPVDFRTTREKNREDRPYLECCYCGTLLRYRGALVSHVRKEHPNDPVPVRAKMVNMKQSTTETTAGNTKESAGGSASRENIDSEKPDSTSTSSSKTTQSTSESLDTDNVEKPSKSVGKILSGESSSNQDRTYIILCTKAFKCYYCKARSNVTSYIKRHILEKHQGSDVVIKNNDHVEKKRPEFSFACMLLTCSFMGASKAELDQHYDEEPSHACTHNPTKTQPPENDAPGDTAQQISNMGEEKAADVRNINGNLDTVDLKGKIPRPKGIPPKVRKFGRKVATGRPRGRPRKNMSKPTTLRGRPLGRRKKIRPSADLPEGGQGEGAIDSAESPSLANNSTEDGRTSVKSSPSNNELMDIDAVGDVTSKIKVSDVTDKSGYRHYPDISNEITDSMKREYKLRGSQAFEGVLVCRLCGQFMSTEDNLQMLDHIKANHPGESYLVLDMKARIQKKRCTFQLDETGKAEPYCDSVPTTLPPGGSGLESIANQCCKPSVRVGLPKMPNEGDGEEQEEVLDLDLGMNGILPSSTEDEDTVDEEEAFETTKQKKRRKIDYESDSDETYTPSKTSGRKKKRKRRKGSEVSASSESAKKATKKKYTKFSTSDQYYECRYCEVNDFNIGHLKEHLKTAHPKQELIVVDHRAKMQKQACLVRPCPYQDCTFSANNQSVLAYHVLSHDTVLANQEKVSEEECDLPGRFQCGSCTYVGPNVAKMYMHAMDTHGTMEAVYTELKGLPSESSGEPPDPEVPAEETSDH